MIEAVFEVETCGSADQMLRTVTCFALFWGAILGSARLDYSAPSWEVIISCVSFWLKVVVTYQHVRSYCSHWFSLHYAVEINNDQFEVPFWYPCHTLHPSRLSAPNTSTEPIEVYLFRPFFCVHYACGENLPLWKLIIVHDSWELVNNGIVYNAY